MIRQQALCVKVLLSYDDMRLLRLDDHGVKRFAYDNEDGSATVCHGSWADGWTAVDEVIDLSSTSLLPPVVPGKIVGVGLNYAGHAKEHGHAVPAVPLIFFKPVSAVVGPGHEIRVAAGERRTDAEGELVVVIGRRATRVAVPQAIHHVAGYTCGNDVSERTAQGEDGGWPDRSKGYDTFAPIGPAVVSELPQGARLRTAINDKLVQDAPVDDLIFDVSRLISFISHVTTLEPGDLVFTGTPSGVSMIQPGDRVTVTVDGIGSLENVVTRRSEPANVSGHG